MNKTITETICEHEFESYDSERIGVNKIVVFYECVKCHVEMDDVHVEQIEE